MRGGPSCVCLSLQISLKFCIILRFLPDFCLICGFLRLLKNSSFCIIFYQFLRHFAVLPEFQLIRKFLRLLKASTFCIIFNHFCVTLHNIFHHSYPLLRHFFLIIFFSRILLHWKAPRWNLKVGRKYYGNIPQQIFTKLLNFIQHFKDFSLHLPKWPKSLFMFERRWKISKKVLKQRSWKVATRFSGRCSEQAKILLS